MRFEPLLRTEYRRRRAIGQWRAHRQRDRVGDRRRREHLVDRERLAELRKRVVHRVLVILGAHGGDLPLRRAVVPHVPAAHGGVDGHELAVRAVGFRAWRRHDALAHPDQRLVVLLGARHVPAALENREGLDLVRDVHLFAADRQRDIGSARLQALHREIEARTARGAGVLDVVDRNSLDADLAEDDLARDRDLALQRAVRHARVVGDADVARLASGVLQRALERLAREVVDRALRMAPEYRHRNAGNVDVSHGSSCRISFAGPDARLPGDHLEYGRVAVGQQAAQPVQ